MKKITLALGCSCLVVAAAWGSNSPGSSGAATHDTMDNSSLRASEAVVAPRRNSAPNRAKAKRAKRAATPSATGSSRMGSSVNDPVTLDDNAIDLAPMHKDLSAPSDPGTYPVPPTTP